MGTVRYTTINGEIIAENRNGVRKQYIPDPLGSTVALIDNTQTITDTFQYWPYGEVASRTGTTNTPFQFVGTLGYYNDGGSRSYVRARHLDISGGYWLSVDEYWESEGMYTYAHQNPASLTDSTGMSAKLDRSCYKAPFNASKIKAAYDDFCSVVMNKSINPCCPGWDKISDCVKKKCTGDLRIECRSQQDCNKPKVRGGCGAPDPSKIHCACTTIGGGDVGICEKYISPNCPCLSGLIIHEIIHGCGEPFETLPVCVQQNFLPLLEPSCV